MIVLFIKICSKLSNNDNLQNPWKFQFNYKQPEMIEKKKNQQNFNTLFMNYISK